MLTTCTKKIWANAHETRESLWQLLFAALISVYLHPFRRTSLFCSKNRTKSLKSSIFQVQGHARSSMLIPLTNTSPLIVMISSTFMPICNHFYGRQVNSEKITHFLWGGYPTCPRVRSLLERKRSSFKLLKSTFNGKNFVCRLSWTISSHYGTIHFWNVCRSPRSRKIN